MKLLLSVIGIACLLSFKTLEEVNRNTLEISSNYSECKYSQCQATAKSTGNQCKHCVSNSGDSFLLSTRLDKPLRLFNSILF